MLCFKKWSLSFYHQNFQVTNKNQFYISEALILKKCISEKSPQLSWLMDLKKNGRLGNWRWLEIKLNCSEQTLSNKGLWYKIFCPSVFSSSHKFFLAKGKFQKQSIRKKKIEGMEYAGECRQEKTNHLPNVDPSLKKIPTSLLVFLISQTDYNHWNIKAKKYYKLTLFLLSLGFSATQK